MPGRRRTYEVGNEDTSSQRQRGCAGRWNNLKYSLWDPERKTFAGRTNKSWGK